MNIAYHLLGCSFLLQPWALDPGRVEDRALQQVASQLLDFSILHGCFEVLKKNLFSICEFVSLCSSVARALLRSSPPLANWM